MQNESSELDHITHITLGVYLWWRWEVEHRTDDLQEFGTKRALHAEVEWALRKERELIQYLNTQWITFVPQLIRHDEDSFTYKRFDGERFDTVWDRSNKIKRYLLARQLISHAHRLDEVWVTHGELLRPTSNVRVDTQWNVHIIDFWKASRSWEATTKNLKHVAQWMARVGYIEISTLQSLWALPKDELLKTLLQHLNRTSSSKYRFLGMSFFVVIDLVTKRLLYDRWVLSQLSWIEAHFNLWSAWSIPVPYWLVIICSILVVAWWCIKLIKTSSVIFKLWVTLLISWVIWNGYDRVGYGWVRDFISLVERRPVFNIADVYIVIWSWVMCWYLLSSSQQD